MPPKKANSAVQGVSTRPRTRSAPDEQPLAESPTKKFKHDAYSTDDSDFEIDIGEESQVICVRVIP